MKLRDLIKKLCLTINRVKSSQYVILSRVSVCFSGCQVHHYAVARHSQGFKIEVRDMVSAFSPSSE